MRSRTWLLGVCLFTLAAVASAQPSIYANGIVNGASFVPAGLPNSNIAQGSIFSIFGTNLASVTKQVSDEGFPLKTTSDGTTVNIAAGGGTYKAILLYISAGQINAILPSAVPVGSATVTVTTPSGTTNAQTINVVQSSFGVITRNSAGSGPAIVFNYNSDANQPINAVTETAYPGQVMILWGTGLGPVTFDETRQPVQGNLNTPVEVWVGGQKITPQYKGRSLYAGLDQINFQLPAGVPAGCYVPITIKAGSVVSNAATIAIAPQGQKACSDPLSFGGKRADQLSAGMRLGSIVLNRTSINVAPGTDVTTDTAFGHFVQYSANSLLASSGDFGVSAIGSCSTYTYKGNDTGYTDPVTVQGIDAGNALTLTLPGGGTKTLTKITAPGNVILYMTSSDFSGGMPAPWLGPGNYTINVPGANPGVGAFQATLTVPNPLTWTNMAAITTVPRSSGLTITWSGGDTSDLILISGASGANGVGAGFYCLTNGGAGSFTVPADILSVLPATGTGQNDGGVLMVGDVPPASKPGVTITPTPQSLDAATFMYMFSSGKMVQYQ